MNEQQTESTTELASEQAAVTSSKPVKSAKRRWAMRTLAVSGGALLGATGFLVTGAGQRTVVGWVDHWVDGLSIEQIEGSLQDGLVLKNSRFNSDGVAVKADHLRLDVGFSCLFQGEACVDEVSIAGVNVDVDTSQLPPSEPKESQPFTGLNLPLGVAVKQLNLSDISVKVDQLDLSLKQLSTAASAKGNRLDLAPTLIDGFTLSLAPAANNTQQAVKKAEKSAKTTENAVDWEAIKTQLSQPILTAEKPIQLPLALKVEDLRIKDAKLTQKIAVDKSPNDKPQNSGENHIIHIQNAALRGELTDTAWQIEKLQVLSDRGEIEGNGSLTPKENYPLAWQLKAKMPEWKEIRLPATSLAADLNGELLAKTALSIKTTGVINGHLTGDVQLAEPKMPFNLNLVSDNASYAFNPNLAPLKLAKTNLKLTGDLLNYQLSGSSTVSGMKIPQTEVNLAGKGSLTHFEADEIALKGLGGTAWVKGGANWENGADWHSVATLKQINTAELLPEWAAQLSGSFESKGYAAKSDKPQTWNVELSKVNLNGTLFNKKLSLLGDVTLSEKNWLDVPQLALTYGENHIALKGVLGEKSNLSADIKAPNLQGLIPTFSASLNGKALLTGSLTQPQLDLDLVGNNIAYDQYKIQHLSAKGKVNADKQVQGDLDLAVKQFSYGEIKVNDAHLTLKGNEANHQLSLKSSGQPVAADLQISGHFDRLQQQWKGQLSQVALTSDKLGRFQANQAIGVNYLHSKQSANIVSHCWTNPQLKLCFPTAFNVGAEGKVPLDLPQLDLAVLKPYLPNETQVTGVVKAKGEVAWTKNKAVSAQLDLNARSLKVTQAFEGGQKLPLAFSTVAIKAHLADNQLGIKSDIQLENDGKLITDMRISDLAKSRQLSGTVQLKQLSLKTAQSFLNKGDQVSGNIEADLALAGNTTSPLLRGQLTLNQLKAKANAMPFDVVDGQLAMRFNGASSTLTGRVKTNESELRLEGDADWRNVSAWRSRIRAQADKFRLDIPNMAKVDVSPNIEVTVTPKALNLGGEITIPWARIEVEELPESAVTVSSDEVIMEGNAKKKRGLDPALLESKTNHSMAINANVNINIGNDVRLNAYGLKTNLKGVMTVSRGKNGLGLYGNVNLEQGRYAAFGQDLLIQKGIIQFAGLPSQPTLDIEAIRNPEAMEDPSVKAGVKVTGLADSPEVKVFSDPSMSQNQALSYVLTGRSLENSGDSGSSNSMAAALLSLSLAKSSKMVGAVGSTFGLKDLNVSTAGIGDNTKVEVSASLAPKFRVKYGVGIFAPLTELTLRYNLAPKLYLQWVSSINQAINLVYRFEFD